MATANTAGPQGRQAQPTSRPVPRTLLVVVSVVADLLMSGIIFGYSGVVKVLTNETKAFAASCAPGENLPCPAQFQQLSAAFTLGVSTMSSSGIPIGIVLDAVGPRYTTILGALIFAGGLLSFAAAPLLTDQLYYAGFLLLALGGPAIITATMNFADLFPSVSSAIISAQNGALDASSAVMFLMGKTVETWGVSLASVMMAYLAVPLGLVGFAAFLFPDQPFTLLAASPTPDPNDPKGQEEGLLKRLDPVKPSPQQCGEQWRLYCLRIKAIQEDMDRESTLYTPPSPSSLPPQKKTPQRAKSMGRLLPSSSSSSPREGWLRSPSLSLAPPSPSHPMSVRQLISSSPRALPVYPGTHSFTPSSPMLSPAISGAWLQQESQLPPRSFPDQVRSGSWQEHHSSDAGTTQGRRASLLLEPLLGSHHGPSPPSTSSLPKISEDSSATATATGVGGACPGSPTVYRRNGNGRPEEDQPSLVSAVCRALSTSETFLGQPELGPRRSWNSDSTVQAGVNSDRDPANGLDCSNGQSGGGVGFHPKKFQRHHSAVCCHRAAVAVALSGSPLTASAIKDHDEGCRRRQRMASFRKISILPPPPDVYNSDIGAQVRSPIFWVLMLVSSYLLTRSNFYIASINRQLAFAVTSHPGYSADPIAARQATDSLVDAFNYLMPLGGIVSVPLSAWVMVRLGITSAFVFIGAMSSMLSLLQLLAPSLPLAFQVVGFLVYTVLRSFMFGALAAFMGQVFGFRNFGRLLGLNRLASAFITTVQYPLIDLAENHFGGDYRSIDVCFLVMELLLMTLFPLYLWKHVYYGYFFTPPSDVEEVDISDD